MRCKLCVDGKTDHLPQAVEGPAAAAAMAAVAVVPASTSVSSQLLAETIRNQQQERLRAEKAINLEQSFDTAVTAMSDKSRDRDAIVEGQDEQLNVVKASDTTAFVVDPNNATVAPSSVDDRRRDGVDATSTASVTDADQRTASNPGTERPDTVTSHSEALVVVPDVAVVAPNPPTLPPLPSAPPSEWQEFLSPDGRKFYYNSRTQESRWQPPATELEPSAGLLGGMEGGMEALAMRVLSMVREAVDPGAARQREDDTMSVLR